MKTKWKRDVKKVRRKGKRNLKREGINRTEKGEKKDEKMKT